MMSCERYVQFAANDLVDATVICHLDSGCVISIITERSAVLCEIEQEIIYMIVLQDSEPETQCIAMTYNPKTNVEIVATELRSAGLANKQNWPMLSHAALMAISGSS